MFSADLFKWARHLNADSMKAASNSEWERASTLQGDARTAALEALFKGTSWERPYRELKDFRNCYAASSEEFMNLATTLELAAEHLKKMSEWSWLEFELRRDAEIALKRAIGLEKAAA